MVPSLFHQLHFSLPSASVFQLPPSNDPIPLPPAASSSLSTSPFSISPAIYTTALSVKVPITIALVYAVTTSWLNRYNRSRGGRPWPLARTRAFFVLLVAHNIFLAVYSAWTFLNMHAALQRSFVKPVGPHGLAGTVDTLCRIHGPGGYGEAVTWDPAKSGGQWTAQSPDVRLDTTSGYAWGQPDALDRGRLWNEGLAFYGWWFYLSKFYEVIDTLIILAKGKQSSVLQTYHHAGAMMCMWAGIRYMSPPIWLFVYLNSAIHAMMYTYYAVVAFAIPVPRALKRSLTSMQIGQFVLGASYAALHSFVSYTIPVHGPATAAASIDGISMGAGPVATGFSTLLKRFLLRAAGEEGVAENVHHPNHNHALNVADAMARAAQAGQHTWQDKTIPCLDTSGQTFAVWLNVLYLTPLTILFMRFFARSYLRRSTEQKTTTVPARLGAAEKAGQDAFKGTRRALEKASKGRKK